MMLSSLMLLLLSNAVAIRRDKSILYTRVSQIMLILTCYIIFNGLYLSYFDKGIGLYNGLFHITSITHVFHFFILFLTSIILTLTAFYPRKV